MYVNIIKIIYDKPTANILKDERMKAFPLRSEIRSECLLSPPIFNKVLKVLAKSK